MQSAIIVEVTDKATRDQLSEMNAKIMGHEGMDPFYGAPVVLVVLADKSRPTHVYDGSLVMGNLMNAAHALGVGSCWIHRAKEEFESEEGQALLKKWGIEGDYERNGTLRPWISEESSATGKTTKRKFCVLCKVMKADAKSGVGYSESLKKQKEED